MSNKKRKEKEEQNYFFSLLGKKTESPSSFSKKNEDFSFTQKKCLICKKRINLIQCIKCDMYFCIDCIKKISLYKDYSFIESQYICHQCNKKEMTPIKSLKTDFIECFICGNYLKGKNKHNYFVNEKQRLYFKNKIFNKSIFLEESNEIPEGKENDLSIITICDKCYINYSEIVDLILKKSLDNINISNNLLKRRDVDDNNLSHNIFKLKRNKNIFKANNKNNDINDKNQKEKEIKNIEIDKKDIIFNKDSKNEAINDENINLNDEFINKENFQKLLKIKSLLNDINIPNINEIKNNNVSNKEFDINFSKLFPQNNNNPFSSMANFLNLNNSPKSNISQNNNKQINFSSIFNNLNNIASTLNPKFKANDNQFSYPNIFPNLNKNRNNIEKNQINLDLFQNNNINNANNLNKCLNISNDMKSNIKEQNEKKEDKNNFEKSNKNQNDNDVKNKKKEDNDIHDNIYLCLYKTKDVLSQMAKYLNKFENNNVDNNISILTNIDILTSIFSMIINKMKNDNKNNNSENDEIKNIDIEKYINNNNDNNEEDIKRESIPIDGNIYEYYLNYILRINDSFKNKLKAIKLYNSFKSLFLTVLFKNIESLILKLSKIIGVDEMEVKPELPQQTTTKEFHEPKISNNFNSFIQQTNNAPLNMKILNNNNLSQNRNLLQPLPPPLFNLSNNNLNFPANYSGISKIFNNNISNIN